MFLSRTVYIYAYIYLFVLEKSVLSSLREFPRELFNIPHSSILSSLTIIQFEVCTMFTSSIIAIKVVRSSEVRFASPIFN